MYRKTIKISIELYENLKETQNELQLSSVGKTIEYIWNNYSNNNVDKDIILLNTILRIVQENNEIWNVYLNNTLVAEDEYKDEAEHKFIQIAKQLNNEKNSQLRHRNKLNSK